MPMNHFGVFFLLWEEDRVSFPLPTRWWVKDGNYCGTSSIYLSL